MIGLIIKHGFHEGMHVFNINNMLTVAMFPENESWTFGLRFLHKKLKISNGCNPDSVKCWHRLMAQHKSHLEDDECYCIVNSINILTLEEIQTMLSLMLLNVESCVEWFKDKFKHAQWSTHVLEEYHQLCCVEQFDWSQYDN